MFAPLGAPLSGPEGHGKRPIRGNAVLRRAHAFQRSKPRFLCTCISSSSRKPAPAASRWRAASRAPPRCGRRSPSASPRQIAQAIASLDKRRAKPPVGAACKQRWRIRTEPMWTVSPNPLWGRNPSKQADCSQRSRHGGAPLPRRAVAEGGATQPFAPTNLPGGLHECLFFGICSPARPRAVLFKI